MLIDLRWRRLVDNFDTLDERGQHNLVGLSEMHLMAQGAFVRPAEARILGDVPSTPSASEDWQDAPLVMQAIARSWYRDESADETEYFWRDAIR